MMGSASVSVMRTRHASARLIGTSEYFSSSFTTGSTLPASAKATSRARRRSSAPRLGAPRPPRRWKDSDSAASQVDQGGGSSEAWITAHSWYLSRLLSSATTNPASTRTFLAITRALQVLLLTGSEVGRQAIHGSDEIGDGIEGRRASPLAASALEPFANYIGLRDLAPARFRLDVCHQWLGQSYGESLHASVYYISDSAARQATEPASLLTTVTPRRFSGTLNCSI